MIAWWWVVQLAYLSPEPPCFVLPLLGAVGAYGYGFARGHRERGRLYGVADSERVRPTKRHQIAECRHWRQTIHNPKPEVEG